MAFSVKASPSKQMWRWLHRHTWRGFICEPRGLMTAATVGRVKDMETCQILMNSRERERRL